MSAISTAYTKIGIYTLVETVQMVYIIRVEARAPPLLPLSLHTTFSSIMPSTKPYADCYNVESIYTTGFTETIHGELTDAEIDALIESESDDHKKPMIHSDLSGDDYADAMMQELGL